MDIETIKERIKQDIQNRKSPDYYKWTDGDGTEHDVFNYTSALYFLESMIVHIIRAGKKESESLESDLKNAYNCGICVLVKLKEKEIHPEILAAIDANDEVFIDFYENACTISVQDLIKGTWEYIRMPKPSEEFCAFALQFLIWYNINKERE